MTYRLFLPFSLLLSANLLFAKDSFHVPNKYFIYARNNLVMSYDFATHKATLLCEIPKNLKPSLMSNIQICNKRLLWQIGASLISWDGGKFHMIPIKSQDQELPNTYYAISPDAKSVIWSENMIIWRTPDNAPVDDTHGESITDYSIYMCGIDGTNKNRIYSAKFKCPGYFTDDRETRCFVKWSAYSADRIYMQKFVYQQLGENRENMISLSVSNHAISMLDSTNNVVLAISPDDQLIALTPNDETCCSGSNYTNNLVSIKRINGKTQTIFDEWAEFGNRSDSGTNDEREFFPINAYFSPDNRWIEINIVIDTVLASIRSLQEANRTIQISKSLCLGWLSPDELLMCNPRTRPKYNEGYIADSLCIYNIRLKKKTMLGLSNVEFISTSN